MWTVVLIAAAVVVLAALACGAYLFFFCCDIGSGFEDLFEEESTDETTHIDDEE